MKKTILYSFLFLLGFVIGIYFMPNAISNYNECKVNEDKIIDYIEKEITYGSNDYIIEGSPYEDNLVVHYENESYSLKLEKENICNMKSIEIIKND